MRWTERKKLNPNADMEMVIIKEQLDDIVKTLGGSVLGTTRTPGLLDLVNELSDKLNEMIKQFAHAEDWRVKFKSAQADHEARNERRRLQLEQREYEASQKEIELEQLRRDKRNSKMIAIATGIAGFVLSELFKHYFGK